MPTITPEEARQRFGEIMHAATRTYREFEEPQPVRFKRGEVAHVVFKGKNEC